MFAFLMFVASSVSFASERMEGLTLSYLGCQLAITINYEEFEPTDDEDGDEEPRTVVFLHGLGDGAANHYPLYREWTRQGFRVLAIDLPSHGGTTGASINAATFRGLSTLVNEFLWRKNTQGEPLVLAGWSTGGLLALRMVQTGALKWADLNGLVLFAPGVSVKTFVGDTGMITTETLTRNPDPPHLTPVRPRSPFHVLPFALRIKMNSWLAQLGELPKDLPTMVFLGGDESDRYINTSRTRRWFEHQAKLPGRKVWVHQYTDAFHELDNEIEEVARAVRQTAAEFSNLATYQAFDLFEPPGLTQFPLLAP